jgi:hypothetical protein
MHMLTRLKLMPEYEMSNLVRDREPLPRRGVAFVDADNTRLPIGH